MKYKDSIDVTFALKLLAECGNFDDYIRIMKKIKIKFFEFTLLL